MKPINLLIPSFIIALGISIYHFTIPSFDFIQAIGTIQSSDSGIPSVKVKVHLPNSPNKNYSPSTNPKGDYQLAFYETPGKPIQLTLFHKDYYTLQREFQILYEGENPIGHIDTIHLIRKHPISIPEGHKNFKQYAASSLMSKTFALHTHDKKTITVSWKDIMLFRDIIFTQEKRNVNSEINSLEEYKWNIRFLTKDGEEMSGYVYLVNPPVTYT